MGGMGTPQGPAGEEKIMASRNFRTVQRENCFLDFTTHRSNSDLPQALVTTSGGDFWTRTARAPLKVRRSSPNSSWVSSLAILREICLLRCKNCFVQKLRFLQFITLPVHWIIQASKNLQVKRDSGPSKQCARASRDCPISSTEGLHSNEAGWLFSFFFCWFLVCRWVCKCYCAQVSPFCCVQYLFVCCVFLRLFVRQVFVLFHLIPSYQNAITLTIESILP